MGLSQLEDVRGRPVDLPGVQKALGAFPNLSPGDKFGFFNAVGTSEITVWDGGTLYAYPSGATTMTLSSSSANDDVAGTGARTVEVQGLDGNYDAYTETFDMDGQTAVTITTDLLRVFRLKVKSAGSGGTAAGTIYVGEGTVTAGVPATVYAQITIGENQTLMAMRTVPRGCLMLVYGITYDTAGNAVNAFTTFTLKVRPLGEVFQTKDKLVLQRGSKTRDHGLTPLVYPEKTDIEIRAVTSSGTADANAGWYFDLYRYAQ